MSDRRLTALWRVSSSFQCIAMWLMGLLAIVLTASLALSTAGLLPGVVATLQLSDGTSLQVGSTLHATAALVALLLLSYMPAHWRMRRLEAGHRSFRMGMEDVTRAYEVAHLADREGAFRLRSEYDAVRERLGFLAEHPDLGHLEPEILEVAAQMSQTSRDLAVTYSDVAIDRAQGFLAARQAEADEMDIRIETAFAACREIKRLNEDLSLKDDIIASRLDRLRNEIDDVMPLLGLSPPRVASKADVIPISSRPKPRDFAVE